LTGDDHTIRASGGFARSHQWLQMMADLFGYEVLVPESPEASGFGAAVLAMHAIGALSDLSHTQHLIRVHDRYQPNLERSSQYHDLFKLYQQIYDRLVEQFSTIADYQRQPNK
jgi:gluconokinase